MKPSLRTDQIADLAYLIGHDRSLMLHEPGVGKTPTVCFWLYYHWSRFEHRTVWVMPTSLMNKNKDELVRFTDFVPSDICIVTKEADFLLPAKVYIVTPARFRLSWEKFPADVQVVAADEPHMYWTNNDSKVSQALYAAMRKIKYFVGMTGTIIKGRLNSCYPMLHVIEPRYYPSYQSFMSVHAIQDEWGNVAGWQNAERVTAILSKHAIMRTFASVYGNEAKVIQTPICEMSKEQREAYDEFEANALLELDDSFLEAKTGGVHVLRCRQIMAQPETFNLGASGKDERLKVALADHANNGKPLIIYGAFKPEQRRMAKLVEAEGLTVGLLNGDTPTARRAEIDSGFRSGKIQVLVGSPQVAAVGFNWQETARGEVDHMIFTTLDYGDDTFYQSYRRAIRGQRKSPLLIEVYEYKKSIDQHIFRIIKRKSELSKAVLDVKEVYDLASV